MQLIHVRLNAIMIGGLAVFMMCMLWPWLTSMSHLDVALAFSMIPMLFLAINLFVFVWAMVSFKQNLEKILGDAVPAVLSQEDFYWRYKTGESRIKYSGMNKIGIYKRHILFYIKPNFAFVIPWRDIPEDRQSELRKFLSQMKAQYNI
jgi:hypothetical protein